MIRQICLDDRVNEVLTQEVKAVVGTFPNAEDG